MPKYKGYHNHHNCAQKQAKPAGRASRGPSRQPAQPNHKNSEAARLGQNFLTSRATVRRLLALSDIGPDDLVIEIGPGKGHITRELLPRCKKLLAAELDPGLCAGLQERFAGKGFGLYAGDFLSMPLPREDYKVFANIPFGRTTDILRRLTEAPHPPQAAWLVVELGAAKRFAGDGQGSLRSLNLKPYFQVRIAARIPREEFHPMPRVDAALLELRLRREPDLPWEQRGQYSRFLERAFRQGVRSMLTKRQIATALRLAGLPVPGEDANMKYVQWLCLFRSWRDFGRGK